MPNTHHLNLSILANTVELDLLIGQCVVQGLLGGSLNVGCFFCHASLWLGAQAVESVVHSCVQWRQVRNTVHDFSTKKKNELGL